MRKIFSLFKRKNKQELSKKEQWFKEQAESEEKKRFQRDFIRSSHPVRQKKIFLNPMYRRKEFFLKGWKLEQTTASVLSTICPQGQVLPLPLGATLVSPGTLILHSLHRCRNIATSRPSLQKK